MMNDFLSGIIGSIYKVLPLKESKNEYLASYLDSLLIQLLGAAQSYPILSSNPKYISVVNTIQFFCHNDFSCFQCRREIFRCIEILKKLQSEV